MFVQFPSARVMVRNKIFRSKAWLWLIILLVIIFAALILWQRSIILNYGKEGGSKPHLSLKQVNVHDIGENHISMTAKIMVSNPLLIKLNADRLQYQLFIDSIKILETDFVKPVSIKALDSTMLIVPMVVLRKNLVAVMDRFDRNESDSADYTLKAKLFFRLPIAGEKTYVVNETRRGPAFRLLSLKSEDIDIEKFGFKHSDVAMSLRIENPNVFALTVSDVIYELIIGKDFRLEGEVKDVTTITPRSSVVLPLEMDVHTKNIPRLSWQVLFEKKHTPFRINFRCKIVGTDDTFKDTRLIVTRDGTLNELKKTFPEEDDGR